MANTFIQSIKTIAQSLINNAGYDKTRTGQVVGVNAITNTYSVRVDGHTYPNVKCTHGFSYSVGDIVKVIIPCNQPTQMYIESSILADESAGDKIANAQSLADDAWGLANDNAELIEELEGQIDNKLETWAQMTNPATSWTTSEVRAQHNNDLWYYIGTTPMTIGSVTIEPSKTYQYNGTNNTWSLYQSSAESLFDFADGKTTIWYGTTSSVTNASNGDYLVDNTTGNTYKWDGSTSAWVLQTDYATPINNLSSQIATVVDELGNVYQLYINTTYTATNVIYTAVLLQNGIDITNETTTESGSTLPLYSNDMTWCAKTTSGLVYLGMGASVTIPQDSLYYGQVVTVSWTRRRYAYLLNNNSDNLVISTGAQIIVRAADDLFEEEE